MLACRSPPTLSYIAHHSHLYDKRRMNMNSVSTLLHLAQKGDKDAEATLIACYEPVINKSPSEMEPLMRIANNS